MDPRPADSIYYNGNVITMDPHQADSTAIAIVGEHLVFVGDDRSALALAGAETKVVDLGGKTAIPGLIDSHTHLELTTHSRCYWTDVRGLSMKQIVDTAVRLATERGPGEWVVLQGTFNQEFPDRNTLDRAVPRNPVAIRWSMHIYQLNSCALAVSHIDEKMIAPDGARIRLDTGIIEEGWDLLRYSAHPLATHLQESMRDTAFELFMRHGVTTIHEIAASRNGIAALRAIVDSGTAAFPRIRLSLTAAPGHQPLIEDVASYAKSGLATGFGDSRVKFAGVKIFVDGGRHGALRSSGICGQGEHWGLLTRTPQKLAHELAAAFDAGIQVWVHAIGDLAQEMTLTAIEQAVCAVPNRDHRTRIEHFGNELYPHNRGLERLLEIGGIPAPNPSFIASEPDDPARRIPSDVTKYAMRSLLDSGARPPGNSDTAGAQPFACNPWFTMQCMLERRNTRGVLVSPQEQITVDEALRAFTWDAARAGFQENEYGSIAVGKYADIAILNKNPRTTPPQEFSTITAETVIIGGCAVDVGHQ
jgi:predicted amidohydrolase YtcJ